jgi:hypothetical protein
LSKLGGVDAVYWKATNGFDFSAYALVLEEVAQRSPGADLFIQNDSVLGPFASFEQLVDSADWRISGFLASAAMENHLQSYALVFRSVDRDLAHALQPVLSTGRSLDRWRDVINVQETRLARIAWGRGLSVGALWYAPDAQPTEEGVVVQAAAQLGLVSRRKPDVRDPSLCRASELIEGGFPFLKRSLLGRNAHLQESPKLKHLLGLQGFAVGGAA